MTRPFNRADRLPDKLVPALTEAQKKAVGEMGLPNNPYRRATYAKDLQDWVTEGDPLQRMSKMAQSFLQSSPTGGNLRAVRPKNFDPLASPTNRGIPYYTYVQAREHDEVIKKARAWVRYFYISHNVVPTCHPAGTQIDVGGHRTPIEEVLVGDKVRTHLGRYRSVIGLKQFHYSGDMYTVSVCKNNEKISMTPEHPLYVRSGEEYSWKLPGEINVGDYLLTPILQEDEEDIQKIYLENFIPENGYMHFRVNEVTLDKFSGIVYNMEVEEDESYVANGFASHNCIDIMARFPLVGIEHCCPDSAIKDFFDELFFEDLGYEEFLIELGLEYWKVGEAFPFGEWSNDMGVWVSDELLNPDDVFIHRTTFPRMEAYQLDVSQHLYDVIMTDKFPFEKQAIELNLPGIIENIKAKQPIDLPGSNLYPIQQLADPWANRGTPLLMRGFRQLMLEERLNRAQAAISERLFTPFILLTLGLQNVDGEGSPWIPSVNDLLQTQAMFENLMESDYRTMVHHFGLDIKVPLQGERMPNLERDYERIEGNLLQVFGISRDLLNGGRNQAYASTALSAEFLMQRLNTYQAVVRRFLKSRYEKVAEAQGFYEKDDDGNPKIVRQLYVHEDGTKEIVERRKLLIPGVLFKTMDFRDEKAQRDFLNQLKNSGVLISNKTQARGFDWDPQEEKVLVIEEEVDKVITQAEIRKRVAQEVAKRGLTSFVDPEWVKEMAEDAVKPPQDTDAGNSEDEIAEETPEQTPEQTPQRPEQSDEQRKDMPKTGSQKATVTLQDKYMTGKIMSNFESLGVDRKEDIPRSKKEAQIPDRSKGYPAKNAKRKKR